MAKLRSPNYPSITLADAIERIRQVYGAEHTHPASREVIAHAMGYASLSGASLPIIGALRRYALLVEHNDGMRVSDDAVAVLELPEGDTERTEAFRRIAFAPDLFADLRDEFGEKLPSDANLRHYLIKRKFLPKAADEVIRVYRSNLELVGFGDEEYNGGMEAAIQQPITDTQSADPRKAATLQSATLPSGYREDVCSLDEGSVTIRWPLALTEDNFNDLNDWIETIKRKIQRHIAKHDPKPGEQ